MKKLLSVCVSGAIAVTFIASADVSASSINLDMLDDDKNKSSNIKKNYNNSEESLNSIVKENNLPITILGDYNAYKYHKIEDDSSVEILYSNTHDEEIMINKENINNIMSAYYELAEIADMNIDEITITSENNGITEIEVSGYKVELLCENGKVKVAKWSDGDYNYNVISNYGITVEEMTNLVLEIIYGENIDIIPSVSNPNTQFNTLEEAQEDIGFGIDMQVDLFSNVTPVKFSTYKYNEDKMLEVIYQNKNGKDITLRKGNFEDNSGVNKDFSEISEINVKGIDVTLKGEDNTVEVAQWAKGDYNYSISLEKSISIYEIANIVQDALYEDVKKLDVSSQTKDENKKDLMLGNMINPYIEFKTIKEAQQDVGFNLDLPFDLFDNYDIRRCVTYNYGKDKFIEVIYKNNNGKDITVRQGTIEDISGVYTEYSENSEINVNGIKVSLEGYDDNVEVIEWATADYNYSIVLEEPISIYEIGNIIQYMLYSEDKTINTKKDAEQESLQINICGLANPYIEYDTIEQAEENAGFTLDLQVDILNDYIANKYSACNDGENKVLEIIYENSNHNNITIRKGTIEEISGVNTDYTESLDLSVNGKTVTFNGENDNVEVIEWSDGDYNYSIVLDETMSRYDSYTLIHNLIG